MSSPGPVALNQLQKVLETANIKLDVVVSDVAGVSSRQMITALSAGIQDAGELTELAKGSLRRKRPQLRMALEGRVQEHQRFLLGLILEHIEYLERLIHRVPRLTGPEADRSLVQSLDIADTL